MRDKKNISLYQAIGDKARTCFQESRQRETLDLSKTVRALRNTKGISGAELCRRAGDLDAKTLTAVEKGRIRNPSVKTLLSLARGLGITVADLFSRAEIELDRNFYAGSQKGAFKMEFPEWGVKVVSFTPFIKDFFCGKIILGPRCKINQGLINHPLPLFVSNLLGRFEIRIGDRQMQLKEGENLFLNGALQHSFFNPLQRESVMLLVTAPSFVG